MLSSQKIGLIAGQGTLPEILLAHWQQQGLTPVVIGLEGITPLSVIDGHLSSVFSIGQAGHILRFLKSHGVAQLVMAGGLKRPNFWTLVCMLKIDWEGFKIISKIIFRKIGDDTLLKIIRDRIRQYGIDVVGAHEFMPEILCPAGVLGLIQPSTDQFEIVRNGFLFAKQHGKSDKGQSVVVNENGICGCETADGTNALIHQCKNFSNPILVKVSKPQQDLALDMPTIGIPTVQNAKAAGFKGIAIEAGKTIILDKDEVIQQCNNAGMFMIGIEPNDT